MTSKTIKGRDIHYQSVDLEIDKLTWRPGAYALVFNEEGQILVVKNRINQRYEFPGGGVEIDELFEEALVREVWEETGLTVAIDALILADDEFFLTPSGHQWHTFKCFYRCHVVEGEMRGTILEDEQLDHPQWVDPHMLNEDNLTIGWEALWKVIE